MKVHTSLLSLYSRHLSSTGGVWKKTITRVLIYLLLVYDELLVYEGLQLLVYEDLLRL